MLDRNRVFGAVGLTCYLGLFFWRINDIFGGWWMITEMAGLCKYDIRDILLFRRLAFD